MKHPYPKIYNNPLRGVSQIPERKPYMIMEPRESKEEYEFVREYLPSRIRKRLDRYYQIKKFTKRFENPY